MNGDQRELLAKSWMEKADSALQDARLLMENGRFSSCVNRLYYSVFFAACAVLASRGESYSRHSAVRSSIHRDFVNTGLLSKEQGRIYDILLSRREQSDYQPSATFTADEVSDYLHRAAEMIDSLKKLTY
jgi:uncharacterized protein (UPF0332 family)